MPNPASSSSQVTDRPNANPNGLSAATVTDTLWDSLKMAIASSSGFQRWQLEREIDPPSDSSLDYRVRRYLRETLETLAY